MGNNAQWFTAPQSLQDCRCSGEVIPLLLAEHESDIRLSAYPSTLQYYHARSVHRSQDPRRSSSFLQVEATGLIGANIESVPELKSSMRNPRLPTEFELISTQVLVSDIVDVRERPRGINDDAGLAIGSEAEKGRADLDRLDPSV
ncbi:hypothetical protein Plec18167_002011 [Paecilomyces lecythidis]|uniref:Uncharacterized protein n=1 Tax=Paecilomyces lecythidis TaxID=3004212 RepID=A0ABR3Y7Y5_9EURO